MQYVHLNEHLKFSRVIQGYWRLAQWRLTPQQRLKFIEQHLELGISTVDHADIYGDYQCEALFGEALALAPQLRAQLQIVSKCGIRLVSNHYPDTAINHYRQTAQHIALSVDNSLTRLQTDHLDVLLIHRPSVLMDADEVAECFLALRQAGKVRHFGVSNFTPAQFSLLQSRLPFALVTNQIELNPLNTQVLDDDVVTFMQHHRIRPMWWSPLAGGRILQSNDQLQPLQRVLQQVAEQIGAGNIEQVLYAWLLKLPVQGMPIVGSGQIARVADAAAALQLTLDEQQWFAIWSAAKGHGVP